MDEIDALLLARLAREPRASHAALARLAGLTRNAVTARIERLTAEGVLMGVYALPHPDLFARHTLLAVWRGKAADYGKLDRFLAAEELLSYSLNYDDQLAVTYYAKSLDEPPPQEIARALGPPERVIVRGNPPLQPKGAALSRVEWRVLLALVDEPRASAARLAEMTGLASRTARRHRERLAEGNFVTFVTGILAARATGASIFHVFAHGPATRDLAKLKGVIDAVAVERTESPEGVYALCRATSFGEALSARDRLAATKGIDHVEIILEKEADVAVDRVRRMARAKLAEAEARRAA